MNVKILETIYSTLKTNLRKPKFGYIFRKTCFADQIEGGDTTTSRDLVKLQYESLPYPPVPDKVILAEEKWYKNGHETPMVIARSNTLEKTNHYLHQGKENFR